MQVFFAAGHFSSMFEGLRECGVPAVADLASLRTRTLRSDLSLGECVVVRRGCRRMG